MAHMVVPPRRLAPASFDAPLGERRRRWVRRHRVVSVLLMVVVLLTPVWWSLGSALTNPGLGTTVSARLAEWVRGHGGGSIVTWAENTWYSHHPPPVGGRPPKGAIPARTRASGVHTPPAVLVPSHLAPPAPLQPIASPAVPGEGQWRPAGRLID